MIVFCGVAVSIALVLMVIGINLVDNERVYTDPTMPPLLIVCAVLGIALSMICGVYVGIKTLSSSKYKVYLSGALIVGFSLVVAVLGGVILMNLFGNQDPSAKEIDQMISSGSYSLAYEKLCERPKDKVTDELIKQYIEGCMDNLDYKRVAEIIPEFSQEMFESPEYLENLFNDFQKKGKLSVLETVFDEIYSKSEAIAIVIDKFK